MTHKIAKDSYFEYLESQLSKFTTFIAQSPMNEKRIDRMQELINQQQQRIYDLESSLKLNTIYHHQNMNQMYRRKSSSLKGSEEKLLKFNEERNSQGQIERLEVEMDLKYQQMSQKINEIQKSIDFHVAAKKSSSKNKQQKRKTKYDEDIILSKNTELNYELESRIIEICKNNVEHITAQFGNKCDCITRSEFDQYKIQAKNNLKKKLQPFFRLLQKSTTRQFNSNTFKSIQPSSSIPVIPLIPSKKLSKQKQNVDINIPIEKSKRGKRQSTTIKIKDRVNEPNNVPAIKQFDYETERERRIGKQKQNIDLSRSKSNCSRMSKKSRKSNRRQKSRQKLKSKIQNLQKLCEITNNLKIKKQNKDLVHKINELNIKHQKQKSNKPRSKSKSKSKLDRQSRSQSHSVSKSKRKFYSKKRHSLDKSDNTSLLSKVSCSRSHSQISQISKKSKKHAKREGLKSKNLNSITKLNTKKQSNSQKVPKKHK